MKRRIGLVALVAVVGLWTATNLLACGDKFLVAGRGTRYQRPKNFRAASILIYTNPSTGLEASLRKVPLDSVLKREGHRATRVAAPEQLSATLANGGFDVVVADSGGRTASRRKAGRAGRRDRLPQGREGRDVRAESFPQGATSPRSHRQGGRAA